MTVALDLVSVTAGYGDNPIVREFSATLDTGTITTLIGGNGAGKSTLLRAIYGTNRFFDGEIAFKGQRIERLPPWERLKRGVGFVPQGRCNFPAMSVEENLKMGCYTLAGGKHEAAIGRVTALFPMLRQKWRWCCCSNPACCCSTSRRWVCHRACRATSSPPCSGSRRPA
jgi:branched-chain amino acid transport system ATP-binding protein